MSQKSALPEHLETALAFDANGLVPAIAQQHDTGEVLMVAKTLAGHLHELEQRLLELHPYDTPQFVVLDVDHVEQRYLDWLVGSATRGGSVSDG